MPKPSSFGTWLRPDARTSRTLPLSDSAQEFKGYAGQVRAAIDSIETTSAGLDELALGGTAVGTGIGTHTKFSGLAIAKLNGILNATFKETTNHFQAQSTIDAVVRTSGALKAYAMSLMKIANDIRWLVPAHAPGSERFTANRSAGFINNARQGKSGHRRIGNYGKCPGPR